jgi:hypothetical protein
MLILVELELELELEFIVAAGEEDTAGSCPATMAGGRVPGDPEVGGRFSLSDGAPGSLSLTGGGWGGGGRGCSLRSRRLQKLCSVLESSSCDDIPPSPPPADESKRAAKRLESRR